MNINFCAAKNITVVITSCLLSINSYCQDGLRKIPGSKKISTNLFGLFFEDINYAADGGLYAELIQNRSFEYCPSDNKQWHSFSFWEYINPGFSYGTCNVETGERYHISNPHYAVLNIEHVGNVQEQNSTAAVTPGVGIRNSGFGNIQIKTGETYNFAINAKQLSSSPINLLICLQNKNGKNLAQAQIAVNTNQWAKYNAQLVVSEPCDSTQVVVLGITEGKVALDNISLFPTNTFKNRINGLRSDLAQVLADMKPAFMRFPGGCLVHGDGLGNMYRWKNTVGPLEERIEQKNIWGYHQSAGLGYYEYFQFCEDIGAKPLPILPAAVSCQNSGSTWRIGGTGQKAIPMSEMQNYIQEVLELIEWANGLSTTKWGSVRAAAGHPAPFNLEYIGIGNEDKITPEFEQRFKMIQLAVKAIHPEITIVGTSGPFHSGEDYEKGWKLATDLHTDVIDEHYYVQPQWLISNQYRYDAYDRKASKVYLGEYASWGNKLFNALAEAIYMTGLERNGDVVSMASYAPLFAKEKFTQWKTDMIFFNNSAYVLTPNYYVQKLFSVNKGDYYIDNMITKEPADSLLAASCVYDSKTGDINIKLVNAKTNTSDFAINLTKFKKIEPVAAMYLLTGDAGVENSFKEPNAVIPVTKTMKIGKQFTYKAQPMSLTVIKVKTRMGE